MDTALVKLTALVKELKFVANAIVRWFPQFLKNSTVLLESKSNEKDWPATFHSANKECVTFTHKKGQ